jgi:hypothetical protein
LCLAVQSSESGSGALIINGGRGATGTFFETFVPLANPNAADVTAPLRFLPASGSEVPGSPTRSSACRSNQTSRPPWKARTAERERHNLGGRLERDRVAPPVRMARRHSSPT